MHGYDMPTSKPPSHESASQMTKQAPATEPTGDWKVEDITIRPAANGFIVRCSKKRDVPTKPNEPSNYEDRYDSKEYAFSTVDEAIAFAAQELSGATTEGASAPVVGAEEHAG